MYILPITFEKHKLQHLVGHPHLVVPTPVDTPNPCLMPLPTDWFSCSSGAKQNWYKLQTRAESEMN